MENTKTITTNKKAFHEYFVLESLECGIELSGTEIKSIRQGGANLKDAWCSVDGGEMIIKQLHISPYEHGNIFNKDPSRNRRLLLHKREIMRLLGAVKQEGLALVPQIIPHLCVLYIRGRKGFDRDLEVSEASSGAEPL